MTEVEATADLRRAVEAQARALVDGDLALFASFAASEAIALAYRQRHIDGPRSYDLLLLRADGDAGHSEVRFRGSPNFVMRCAWSRGPTGWKAKAIDIPEDSIRDGWLQRMLRFGNEAPSAPRREDLS